MSLNEFKKWVQANPEKALFDWTRLFQNFATVCGKDNNDFTVFYSYSSQIRTNEVTAMDQVICSWLDDRHQNETDFFKQRFYEELKGKLTNEKVRELVAKEIDLLNQENEELKTDKEKLTHQEKQLQTKISDLENSLLNLAKQKIKGKKEAQALLNQLESNWKDKEQDYQEQITTKQQALTNLELIRQQEQTELEKELNTQTQLLTETKHKVQALTEEKKELATSLQLHQQKIKALESQLVSLSQQKATTQQTLHQTHQELTTTQTHYNTRKNQILLLGIITLMIMVYLGWSKQKEGVEDEELLPKTWI